MCAFLFEVCWTLTCTLGIVWTLTRNLLHPEFSGKSLTGLNSGTDTTALHHWCHIPLMLPEVLLKTHPHLEGPYWNNNQELKRSTSQKTTNIVLKIKRFHWGSVEEVLSNPGTLPGPHPQGPGLSWCGLWGVPSPLTGGPNGAGGQGGGVRGLWECCPFNLLVCREGKEAAKDLGLQDRPTYFEASFRVRCDFGFLSILIWWTSATLTFWLIISPVVGVNGGGRNKQSNNHVATCVEHSQVQQHYGYIKIFVAKCYVYHKLWHPIKRTVVDALVLCYHSIVWLSWSKLDLFSDIWRWACNRCSQRVAPPSALSTRSNQWLAQQTTAAD